MRPMERDGPHSFEAEPLRGRTSVQSALVVGLLAACTACTDLASAPPASAPAATPAAAELRDAVRAYCVAHEGEVLAQLEALLALPNLASDEVEIGRNARELVTLLEERGIRARLLELPGSPPVVFGELVPPGARRTVALYAHYDGQPVAAQAWHSEPWRPVLRDGTLEAGARELTPPYAPHDPTRPDERRLYARSASDDKAPIVAMLTALDALRAMGLAPTVGLQFFFEGEEEAGSPHLAELVRANAATLSADAWLFCDGPVHASRRMQVYFGVRGALDLELTVFGPARALHSGHYGNWAPNPLALLAELVSSMRGADGRVKIAGFYDGLEPITPEERRAIAEAPDLDAELLRSLALARPEGDGEPLAERILLPALNLRGLAGGAVGAQAANAIPTEARASIDFRLVPPQTAEHVRALVEAHVRAQGYSIVHAAPDLDVRRAHARVALLEWGPGYPAGRTPLASPFARALVAAVEDARGEPLVRLPSLGGSVPMFVFQRELGVPVLGLPIVNHDNSQHAADENLRLQNLWDGVLTFAGVMRGLDARWP